MLSGGMRPARDVLVYDETGRHGALSTANWLVEGGAQVKLVTPGRQAGSAIGGQNLPVYLRNLYLHDARQTPDHRLLSVQRDGNRLVATRWNELARVRVKRRVAQVVSDRCTMPADEPFQALKEGARNLGEIDVEATIARAIPASIARSTVPFKAG